MITALPFDQATLIGCCARRPGEHFPLFAQRAVAGKPRLDSLISLRIGDPVQVNEAVAALRGSGIARAVLRFGDA